LNISTESRSSDRQTGKALVKDIHCQLSPGVWQLRVFELPSAKLRSSIWR
jgi:hypothetical protein